MPVNTDTIIIAIAVIALLLFAAYGVGMVLYAKLRWEPQRKLDERIEQVTQYNRREA